MPVELLSNALIRGGITTATLEHLIETEKDAIGDAYTPQESWQGHSALSDLTAAGSGTTGSSQVPLTTSLARDIPGRRPSTFNHGQLTPAPYSSQQQTPTSLKTESANPASYTPSVEALDEGLDHSWTETVQHSKTQREKHTVLLSNLPYDVTHRDITSVVRGGKLIDIWLPRPERTAIVTFASGASEFLQYARRTDLYVQDRKIVAAWSERQYTIAQHLAQKAAKGTSRNLVVRGGAARLTEERIREDLDHIHNCVIIAVITKGLDIFISTNSINNAMFARSCMSSRAAYKGLRIDWYPDECAEPIPTSSWTKPTGRKADSKPSNTKSASIVNRFDLLEITATKDTSEEESGDDSALHDGVHLEA
ncbi:MAG: hypothetical protein M1828_004376 [Chrysothrix sp. TS-e1954]|nr:MAG: hypothetical protein M1828_004376 [Chrysothrix sp. TS-e1954]